MVVKRQTWLGITFCLCAVHSEHIGCYSYLKSGSLMNTKCCNVSGAVLYFVTESGGDLDDGVKDEPSQTIIAPRVKPKDDTSEIIDMLLKTDYETESPSRKASQQRRRSKKSADDSSTKSPMPNRTSAAAKQATRMPPRLFRSPKLPVVSNDPVKSLFPTLPSPLPSDGPKSPSELHDGLRRLLQDEEMLKFAVEVDQVFVYNMPPFIENRH